jgi:hypothetical protein
MWSFDFVDIYSNYNFDYISNNFIGQGTACLDNAVLQGFIYIFSVSRKETFFEIIAYFNIDYFAFNNNIN